MCLRMHIGIGGITVRTVFVTSLCRVYERLHPLNVAHPLSLSFLSTHLKMWTWLFLELKCPYSAVVGYITLLKLYVWSLTSCIIIYTEYVCMQQTHTATFVFVNVSMCCARICSLVFMATERITYSMTLSLQTWPRSYPCKPDLVRPLTVICQAPPGLFLSLT